MGRGLFDWAREASDRGAGEILFTSMNHDGVKTGYANEALARLSDTLPIPVIASGGAGTMEHFADAFTVGKQTPPWPPACSTSAKSPFLHSNVTYQNAGFPSGFNL